MLIKYQNSWENVRDRVRTHKKKMNLALNRRTQLLLPPALKVAKSACNLPMIKVRAIAEEYFFFHGQVAKRFAIQNLTLPPSMPVAKVTEYV